MAHYFDRTQTDMTWAINAYTLAFGGLLLLGGRAGDILGRRQMFILGLGLFSLGSLLGGLATTFELLLMGRVVQGIGGAIAVADSPVADHDAVRRGPGAQPGLRRLRRRVRRRRRASACCSAAC